MPEEKNKSAGIQPISPDIQIIEYELLPKTILKSPSKKKRPASEFSVEDLVTEHTPMAEDVAKEKSFRLAQKEVISDDTETEDMSAAASTYSIEDIQNLSDHFAEMALTVEAQKIPVITKTENFARCFYVRECPDHTCMAYQAEPVRCWFVAGDTCGCRTHLGIPSCFDCQVFQMATSDPMVKIREILYYFLGVVRRHQEKIRIQDREIRLQSDRLHRLSTFKDQGETEKGLNEENLIGELMRFTKDSQRFESERDKEVFEHQKLLTEQLGSAYLQLQAMTTELERANKDLESKVAARTEELRVSNVSLREAIKKAQEADRLKSEFIANVSHELRTPLNSIIGFSKVLLGGLDGDITETQKVDLSAIYNSGRHLLEIINSILDISKIEAGKMELNISQFDVSPLISEIVTASQTLIMSKKLKIESRVPEGLPLLEADQTKIRQIIFNLVSNAAKFTEEGSITIRASTDEDIMEISVVDTGIGIEKDELAGIFERFRQVDGTSTRRAGGTGLGLSIARKFAEMHNGTLLVESKLGKGSVFTVVLPLKYRRSLGSGEDMGEQ